MNLSQWKKPVIITFLYGTVLLGITDFFHTATGVQRYLFESDILIIQSFHWPWYVPLQMGTITVTAMVCWVVVYNSFLRTFFQNSTQLGLQPFGTYLPFFVAIMILFAFVLGYYTISWKHHMLLYVAIYVVSIVFIHLKFSTDYLLAFLLVSLTGPTVEWFLLSPSIGYYEFVQKDILGRIPGWLFFAYGWGGTFFHWISKDIRI